MLQTNLRARWVPASPSQNTSPSHSATCAARRSGCTSVCGHEREFDVSPPPFDHVPDETVVRRSASRWCARSAGRRGTLGRARVSRRVRRDVWRGGGNAEGAWQFYIAGERLLRLVCPRACTAAGSGSAKRVAWAGSLLRFAPLGAEPVDLTSTAGTDGATHSVMEVSRINW